MYIFSGSEYPVWYAECHNVLNLHYFRAIGNSVYEIALLYQKGLIKREFISANTYSKTLYISVLNSHEYRFKDGNAYHLMLTNPYNGYMRVEICIDEGDYVASWYRPDLSEEVKPETWKELFGSEIPPKKLEEPDEYVYEEDDYDWNANDYTDNNNYAEDDDNEYENNYENNYEEQVYQHLQEGTAVDELTQPTESNYLDKQHNSKKIAERDV